MLKSIFKVALRNLWRQKGFSLINIFGLSIGITACILIFLFIEYESSFDRYHKNSDKIYRIVSKQELPTRTDYLGCTCYPLPPAIKQNFPEYKSTGIYINSGSVFSVEDNLYEVKNILYIDSAFSDIFDIKWLEGNPSALQNKNNIAISEKIAKDWFGSSDAIGKTIKMNGKYNLVISGIVENSPKNSSIPYNIIGSYNLLEKGFFELNMDNWGMTSSGFECFMLLPDNTDLEYIGKRICEIKEQNDPIRDSTSIPSEFYLQPLHDIHKDKDLEDAPNTYTTTKTEITLFALIGIIVLALACINFVNLATAQSIRKAKEVGIRKVSGAFRSQVFFSFISETIIITLIAIFIAFISTEVVLPYFNDLLGDSSSLSMYRSSYFIYFIVGVLLLVLVMAGFYPAFVLSRFQPIKVLRASLNASSSKTNIRNILVTLQFIVSIALIILTLSINKQVQYMKNKDLGFKKENILHYSIPDVTTSNLERIRDELNKHPEVKGFTFGYSAPSLGNNLESGYIINGEEDDSKPTTSLKMVDTNYHKLFGLEVIAGRWFNKPKENDSLFEIVVTEKIARDNLMKPDEILNSKFSIAGAAGKIVGVVKDFHLYSLRQKYGTIAFIYLKRYFKTVQIEIFPEKHETLIPKLNNLWAEIFPEHIPNYDFFEDDLNSNYQQETNTFKILRVFSILGIIIAILGLFGLVSYMVAQQAKVIGIRKVLGASVPKIILWISSSYIRMVIVANVIAWPLGYFILNKWFAQFAFRISMPWEMFILTGFSSVAIAYLVILLQALNISKANPVEVIRSE